MDPEKRRGGKDCRPAAACGEGAGGPARGAAEEAGLRRLVHDALGATANAIVISDRSSRILWANPAAEKLTGYRCRDLLGHTPRLFNSGRQPQSFYRKMWTTILAGETWHGELVNRRKDGSLYEEEMTITPMLDRSGEVTHFVAVKRDVTGRKRAEERASLLAQVVENSTDLIGVGDPEGRVTYANLALRRALGRSEGETLGRHFSTFLTGTDPATPLEEVVEHIQGPGGWRGECVIARPDGTELPVFLSTGRIRNEQGRVLGSYGIAQDISDRKQAEETLRRSEELFRQVTENIREVFFATTPHPARIIYISPAYEEIWGRPRQEVCDRPGKWIQTVHPEDRERVLEAFQRAQSGEPTDSEYRIVRPDGSIRYIRNRTFPVHDEAGRFTRVVGFAADISDHKRADEELRGIHEELNHALEEAEQRARENDMLTELVDMIQCCRSVDQAYALIEETLEKLFRPRAGALCITNSSRSMVEVVAAWGENPVTEKAFAPDDCWALRRGRPHRVEGSASPLRCAHVPEALQGGSLCVPLIAQGETLGLLYLECQSRDVAGKDRKVEGMNRRAKAVAERLSLALANVRMREVLRHQSVRDPLTGLFNRRYMEETLTRELARAARRHDPVAVALCDLDHFKQFNDTFGHEAGDLVLREIATIFNARLRAGDVACRYGGEEFVLILSEATAEVARERAESVVKEVQSLALSHRGRTLGRVTISIGVSVFPEQGTTAADLLHAADQALYRAKREGRDRVILTFPGR